MIKRLKPSSRRSKEGRNLGMLKCWLPYRAPKSTLTLQPKKDKCHICCQIDHWAQRCPNRDKPKTQFSSVTQSCPTFVTPWTAAHQASLSITSSWSLLKLMSIEQVMPYNHFILCHPLLLLHSIFPSIRVFSNESVLCIRCPKYWSSSFSNSPSNEHPGLISFRMDWLDLLAVHGLSRVFSNTTVQKHQFFSAQLSLQSTLTSIHDHWINHSLDQTNLCYKEMSLLLAKFKTLKIYSYSSSKPIHFSRLYQKDLSIMQSNHLSWNCGFSGRWGVLAGIKFLPCQSQYR